ncbi:MAG: hypothetical protein M3R58_14315 [Pseudomonadota bacterium]|nr:hypothetical protein [Pseudomonadota bacterium]
MSAELRQQLADALSMMERAEVIDFNGHMSCRLPAQTICSSTPVNRCAATLLPPT